jgi:hypothetical protein
LATVHVFAGSEAEKHGHCGRLFAQAFFELATAQLDELSNF